MLVIITLLVTKYLTENTKKMTEYKLMDKDGVDKDYDINAEDHPAVPSSIPDAHMEKV